MVPIMPVHGPEAGSAGFLAHDHGVGAMKVLTRARRRRLPEAGVDRSDKRRRAGVGHYVNG